MVVAPEPGAEAVAWQYDVRASGPAVDQLLVDARFAPGDADELESDDDAAPFVTRVGYAAANDWVPVAARGSTRTVPCRALGCRVRYRFALREAATRLEDPETAVASWGGDVYVGPPATGTRVLHDLFREMALTPGTVDLAAPWERLGVHVERGWRHLRRRRTAGGRAPGHHKKMTTAQVRFRPSPVISKSCPSMASQRTSVPPLAFTR